MQGVVLPQTFKRGSMPRKSAFHIAKTRTAQGEAKVREQVALSAMDLITATGTVEDFNEALSGYGIMPGDKRYARALSAWNEAQALKPPPLRQKLRGRRS